MDKDKCITSCYKIDKINRGNMIHPFFNITYLEKDYEGICGINNFKNNIFFRKCDGSGERDIDIKYSLTNPINPEQYLSAYYGLKNIDEIINYIKMNSDILLLTKSRLLDLTYLTYKDDIDRDTNKWIELIKVIFDNNTIKDEIIVKILKKITEKYDFNKKKYPFNLLLKIKKFLDYNI